MTAYRSPFVLVWHHRLPREIVCQNGRKSGAQPDSHTLIHIHVFVCAHRVMHATYVQTKCESMQSTTTDAYCISEGHAHTICKFVHMKTAEQSVKPTYIDICTQR